MAAEYTLDNLETEIKVLSGVKEILEKVKESLKINHAEEVKKAAKQLQSDIDQGLSEKGKEFLEYLQTEGELPQSDGSTKKKKSTTVYVGQSGQQPDGKVQTTKSTADKSKDTITEMSSGKPGLAVAGSQSFRDDQFQRDAGKESKRAATFPYSHEARPELAGSHSLRDGHFQGDASKESNQLSTVPYSLEARQQDPLSVSGEKDLFPDVLRRVQQICEPSSMDRSEVTKDLPKKHPGIDILQAVCKLKERCEREVEDKNKTIQTMAEEKKKEKEQLQKQMTDDIRNMEKKHKIYCEDLENQKNKELWDVRAEMQKQIDSQGMQLQKYSEEYKKIYTQLQQQIEDSGREKYKLNEQINKLHGENKQLKSRVSELAGSKLMDNNPDIADLSDPNRALKLGEKFSGLYDDDWTDAYQIYTEKLKMKEEEAIDQLLKILLRSYDFCSKIAEEQMAYLCNIFESPCQNIPKVLTGIFPRDKMKMTQKQHKDLKDLRKKIALNQTDTIAKQFLSKEKEEAKKGDKRLKTILEETRGYYEKCAEVCWPMVLHDPPVNLEMNVNPGVKIDGNRFRMYGGNGDTLEYLVWPPLVVEGGGLLAKGVAKPKEVKRMGKKT